MLLHLLQFVVLPCTGCSTLIGMGHVKSGQALGLMTLLILLEDSEGIVNTGIIRFHSFLCDIDYCLPCEEEKIGRRVDLGHPAK